MPITVSCPACDSRFSLSDDLYRRRVAGSLVKVKCRTCSAEIAVDATEPSSAPSNEAPRKHPGPPRPKAVTQIGLGTPPPPSGLETSASLPEDDFARQPLPLNATITPLPIDAALAPPVSVDPDSMWGDEETIAINLKGKVPPSPPIAQVAKGRDETEEMEQIDAEEIPVSSSGAPTLDTLTSEAGGAHVPHGRPPADEFLVSFHAAGDSAAGAPTIDVTGIGDEAETPLNAPTVDVTSFASEIEAPKVAGAREEQELEYRPTRGTVPQFDISAVPAPSASANQIARTASATSTPVPPRKGALANTSASDTPARERKFVIPPQASTTAIATPRKARRSRAPLWIGLMVAAGAVGAGFGYRERVRSASIAELPRPVPSPVVNTQAALPAEAIPEPIATAAATSSAAVPDAAATPVAPVAQTVGVATTREVAPPVPAAVKTSAPSNNAATRSPSTPVEPAVEKPAIVESSGEVHNAPTPAAPDTPFDRDAARNALATAATRASSCRKQGDPSGTANLTITFAPSGRVTVAQIQGPPFSGTATGGCIASTMRGASVPAFSGDYVTVSKTIVVQ